MYLWLLQQYDCRVGIMTDRPSDIQTILNQRLQLIQAIADANCEALRLNQVACGMMILDQKDEVDGTAADPRAAERDANDAALGFCISWIEKLEADLADLDRELTTANERKTE